jgi:hypothetical protein
MKFHKILSSKNGKKIKIKILVENTTCQIYERTRNLGGKNPRFGHNKVWGQFFISFL